MPTLLSRNILYTFLLIFLPVLSIISWTNVNLSNFDLGIVSYVVTHLLPTVVLSFSIAILSTDRLHEIYPYTLPKFAFTFMLFFITCLAFVDVASWFGITSLFVTVQLAGVPNAQEIAAKYYTIQLTGSLIMLVIYYSLATYLFGEKSFRQFLTIKTTPTRRQQAKRKINKKIKLKQVLA
jgi:hypothetical protein